MVKVDEFWIQAASFTSRGRADELKEALAEKGIAALISVKDISGKSYYRIRVGPYSVKAEADDWLSRLKGFPGCAEAYVSKVVAQKAKQ
jgi:DedD protein